MVWATTQHPIELCVSVVIDDPVSRQVGIDCAALLDVRTLDEYQRGAVYAWNKLMQWASGDVLALWADDLAPRPGWLDAALGALDEMGGHGLVGFNDLSSNGEDYAAHWLADRAFIVDHLGGVMYPPEYHSWWADREVTDIAKRLGRYRWCRQAEVEHLNYTFGKSAADRTYLNGARYYGLDRLTYERRKARREGGIDGGDWGAPHGDG